MSLRIAPGDARRGGLVILGAGGDALAQPYADAGYETVATGDTDDVAVIAADLAPPVFLLALPDGAEAAWRIGSVAAASIIADARIQPCVDQAPAVPTILHLEPAAHALLADAFAAARPELPVHIHLPTTDGERLLLLRTLRLFNRAGGRGEV